MTWLSPRLKWASEGGGATSSTEEKRDKACSLSLSHTFTHSPAALWSGSYERKNGKSFNTRGDRGGERPVGVVFVVTLLIHRHTHLKDTHFIPPYTPTHEIVWMPAARLDGTQRTPTSHTHVHTPTEVHTVERTMVVQGAVTPGRTRRLMLKLPVGTLRRNSGERVSQGFPFHFSFSLSSFCASFCVCGAIWGCLCVLDSEDQNIHFPSKVRTFCWGQRTFWLVSVTWRSCSRVKTKF